jgi:3-oxoadipate enol-lactonase
MTLHHELTGPADAPVLVLGNSLGATLAMWDPQIDALAEHFRVLRYDHRGSGESPVPLGSYSIDDLGGDLLALLDRLEIERVSMAGVSLGAMVAMWAASEASHRFDRLILACTSAKLGPPELWDERVATVRTSGMIALSDGALDRWLTPEFRATHPDVAQWLSSMIVHTPADGYVACCEAIRDMDLLHRLRSIRAPTLVVSGDEDPATPVEHQRLIAEAIAGARHEVLQPARHLANVEQPDAFTRLMLEHLGR